MKRLCLLLLFCAPCALGAPKTGIVGTITDENGAALSGHLATRVLVHWDASGSDTGLKSNAGIPKDIVVEVDSTGHFEVTLPPGFYDVFVSAMAFSPKCRKVRVRAGEVVTFDAKLRIDPLVSRELADKPF